MNCNIAILTIGLLAALSEGATWDYTENGPSTWGDTYELCKGRSQSPINIETEDVDIDYDLPIVPRSIFYKKPMEVILENNGHTIVATVTDGAYTIPTDTNLLPFPAKLAQYHFHWGNTTTTGENTVVNDGAEHEINSKQYFGELHAVHFNTKYPNISTALPKADGLAVFGWFIDVTYPQTNQDIKYLLELAKQNAKMKGNSSALDASALFSLETIIPPDLDVYYRYKGSLTTPTCDESVVWTVFDKPIEITVEQAKILATSFYETNTAETLLIDNFRPVQPLNDRKVTKPAALVQESGANVARPSILFGMITCALAYLL